MSTSKFSLFALVETFLRAAWTSLFSNSANLSSLSWPIISRHRESVLDSSSTNEAISSAMLWCTNGILPFKRKPILDRKKSMPVSDLSITIGHHLLCFVRNFFVLEAIRKHSTRLFASLRAFSAAFTMSFAWILLYSRLFIVVLMNLEL